MSTAERAKSIIDCIMAQPLIKDRKVKKLALSWYEAGEYAGDLVLPLFSIEFEEDKK